MIWASGGGHVDVVNRLLECKEVEVNLEDEVSEEIYVGLFFVFVNFKYPTLVASLSFFFSGSCCPFFFQKLFFVLGLG